MSTILISLQEFTQKYIGTNQDFDGGWGGQCVDLARMWVQEGWGLQSNQVLPSDPENGGAVHAYTDYPNSLINGNSRVKRIENRPDNHPDACDIIIWNENMGGGCGHIAVVIDANSNNFTVLEQNNGNGNGYGQDDAIKSTFYSDYTNVKGWLHYEPVLQAVENNPPVEIDFSGLNDAEVWAILANDKPALRTYLLDRHIEIERLNKFHIKSEDDLNEWIKEWGVVRLNELGIRCYSQVYIDRLNLQINEGVEEINRLNQGFKNQVNTAQGMPKIIVPEHSVTEPAKTPNIENIEVKNQEKFNLDKFFVGITKDGTFYATIGSLLTGLTTLFPDNHNVTGFAGTVTLLISGLKALTNLGSKLNK
jgi:CHAP domain